MNNKVVDEIIKMILSLENVHHDCKKEIILISKHLLGVEVEDYKKELSLFIESSEL